MAENAGGGLNSAGAWIADSDKSEREEVKVGFMLLTDCASVVMASVLRFGRNYGIKIVPTREASWASVRDKLISGDLDVASAINRIDLYREAAAQANGNVPVNPMRSATMIDGVVWDGSASQEYADEFAIRYSDAVSIAHEELFVDSETR